MRRAGLGNSRGWWCAVAAMVASSMAWAGAQRSGGSGTVTIDADDIGGVVTSAKGPEAGVWVIAETTDLPTKFIRIVVTDDQGRYLLPDLPKARYQVFVRGYGLVDSPRVEGRPGQHLDLKGVVAPDARAAAQVYPANYWLGMVPLPPGKTTSRATCGLSCHQMGNKKTREIEPELGHFSTTLEAWDRRVASGPLGATMQGAWRSLGDDRKIFADWTDMIAAGKSPDEAPPRPVGVLRNVVITEWEWGTPKSFVHTIAATLPYNITANANGRVWGTSNSSDLAVWVDPKTNTSGAIPIRSEAGTIMKNNAPSPDWPDEQIWQPRGQPRSPALDSKGRVFFASAFRGTLTAFGNGQTKDNPQPAFCKTGSSNKYAQHFPLDEPAGKQVGILDPRTNSQAFIDTCFTTDHSYLDPDGTLWFGQHNTVIGWVNINTFDKTHNSEASQGWVPAVLDTNGDGKITKPWTEPDQPVDPTKDHRVNIECYSIATSPKDGSIWCAGRTRSLYRFERGKGGPETFTTEIFTVPDDVESNNHGVEVDSNGVAWQNHTGSKEFTRFDRSKCKTLTGPAAATGKHCPEGWTVYKKREQKADDNDQFYLMFIDREDAFGMGTNVPYTGATNSDAIVGLNPDTGKWFTLRVPYPLGFFTRAVQPRIDDSKAGWKGRGLWTNYSAYTPWHSEGGKNARPKVLKIQLRPDPLAR